VTVADSTARIGSDVEHAGRNPTQIDTSTDVVVQGRMAFGSGLLPGDFEPAIRWLRQHAVIGEPRRARDSPIDWPFAGFPRCDHLKARVCI
jgi:hypothetical protein